MFMEKNLFTRSIVDCYAKLGSRHGGLTANEAANRLKQYGENKLPEKPKKSAFATFLAQFSDIMIIILLIAAAISITIAILNKSYGELVDGFIILAIVLINAVIGFVQEKKAENSIEALKKMTEPISKVYRGGKVVEVHSKELVIGDIVLIEAGDIVPADCRLIESVSLRCDESSLTGESVPTEKDCSVVCNPSTPLAERKNMIFSGSVVANGHGEGIVCATGQDTELGKIAGLLLETKKDDTPLQKGLKQIAKVITYIVLAICAVTFFIELVASPNTPLEAFLTAVAIAVAAIPESLPAVITIIMSLGVYNLAKKKAIVKRMHAVETLGSCEVICSDKTGTLTENKMTVQKVYFDNTLHERKNLKNLPDNLANCMLLCESVAHAERGYIGDPTEIALVDFAENGLGLDTMRVERDFPKVNEIPFDSNRKLMSSIHKTPSGGIVFTKGAVDELLKICAGVEINGEIIPLSEGQKQRILKINKDMGLDALRVLGFAYKKLQAAEMLSAKTSVYVAGYNGKTAKEMYEASLIFVGLVGMQDPPRKEVKKAVAKCKNAGILPVMITGDHKNTAFAVARQIGLASDISEVITGAEIDRLSDAEFERILFKKRVFARVSPENKVRIVEAFKRCGKIVAMTGDGVNDAPSIKKANIGVGMGITGTDVTKEVADVIITDDNFASIIIAVEEGRKIYTNIQKTIQFLFSANLAEIVAIFLATLFFPQMVFLTPVQILFVNLISDTLPAIALGLEPAEKNIMSKKPRKAGANLFSNGVGKNIVIMGLIQGVIMLLCYVYGIYALGGEIYALTMAFYALNIIQFFYFISMRTSGRTAENSIFQNKWAVASVVSCFGLMLLIACTPLHSILGLATLPFGGWAVIGLGCVLTFIASEIVKFCLADKQ